MSNLECRAEELIEKLQRAEVEAKHRTERHASYMDTEPALYQLCRDSAQVIEQLLSENRQVREQLDPSSNHYDAYWLNRFPQINAEFVKHFKEKLQGALTDPFCHEAADSTLAVIGWFEEALRRRDEHESNEATLYGRLQGQYKTAQSTIAQQKEDLDKVSAEREAYREALEPFTIVYVALDPYHAILDRRVWDAMFDKARRILAENDR